MPKYKATAYIRLSYTDDHSSESDSVSNQRKLIENFVERTPDIEVVSEKIDDVSGKVGFSWINIFGLIIVVLLLIPNIIYAFKFRGVENQCRSSAMNKLEQIGRYGCMFLMIFNIGILEFSFLSIGMFLFYTVGNVVLLIVYWIIWMLFFQKQDNWKRMVLAIIPTVLFLISGIALRHILLIIMAVIFGIGHIYVTKANMTTEEQVG